MNNVLPNQRKRHCAATVLIPVLVVILIVGLLSMQALQTLALVRRGDDNRAKIMQARQLSELSRRINWSNAESQSLTLQIPDSVGAGFGTGVGGPETRAAILERQTIADNPETAKIVVRFPADKPGEITTSWEPKDE